MKPCRTCHHDVSEEARYCPQCGAPAPANPLWNGWGWEYKSKMSVGGMPLLHISFKYRQNRLPVVAHGVVAIAQVGVYLNRGIGMAVVSFAEVIEWLSYWY